MDISPIFPSDSVSAFFEQPGQGNSQLSLIPSFGSNQMLLQQNLALPALNVASSDVLHSIQVTSLLTAETAPGVDSIIGKSDTGLQVSAQNWGLLTEGAPANQSSSTKGIVFIDDNVPDEQLLESGINPGLEVVRIDSSKDGIAQITKALQGRSNLESIHIVSHGEAGDLRLGSTKVDSNTLDLDSQQLQSWSSALAPNADILLYGCNVAADDTGKAFVQKIHKLTGADIAASTDLTGSRAKGGNWDLEYSTGKIEADNAFNNEVRQNYTGVLATFNVNANDVSNTGSGTTGGLVWAINQANSMPGDDTINLAANSTYTLNQIDNYLFGPDGLPTIQSKITIEGNGATIQRDSTNGTPNFRFFYVEGTLNPPPYDKPGDLTLKNLTLQGGIAKGGNGVNGGGGGAGMGGAIFNDGALSLEGVTLANNRAQGGNGSSGNGGGGGGIGSDANGATGGGFGGSFTNDGSFGGGGSNGGVGGVGGGNGGGFGGSNGGFGGGSGGGSGGGGNGGGFGGGVYGFGGSEGSGGFGFGGAIFVRTGTLNLSKTTFSNNSAIGGSSSSSIPSQVLSKGGAIFAITPDLVQYAGKKTDPTINFINTQTLSGNSASGAANTPGDTPDFYIFTPTVRSITRSTSSPALTNATNVTYRVTFTHAVNGVVPTDFKLTTPSSAIANPSITSVTSISPSNGFSDTYDVLVDTGSGDPTGSSTDTLRLDMKDDDTIKAANGVPLGGTGTTGVYDGSFTQGDTYTIDKTAPSLTNVSITSNNANNSRAKVGDSVTLNFTASETLQASPKVTIEGQTATVTNTGNNYQTQYTLMASDTEGAIPFNISSFQDTAGNTGTTVTTTTNNSSVTFDKTAPSLTNVSITSNNPNNSRAKIGNLVTLNFTASETLQASPKVTIEGQTATVTNTGNNYQAQYTLMASDTEGAIPFNISSFQDTVGNTGSADNSQVQSVTFDKTAPVLSSITPNNSSTNVSVADNLAISFNENIARGIGNITIKKADGTVFETISVTDAAKVSISNNQLTINPSNDLAAKTAYYVQIDNGAIADLTGNNYAGIGDNTTWIFTTADTTPNTNTTATTPSYQDVGIFKPTTQDTDGVFLIGGAAGQAAPLKFDWTFREAVYNNEVGYFLVDDATGRVGGVAPGDSNYARTALSSSNRHVLFTSGRAAGPGVDLSLLASNKVVFYIIQNSTTAKWLDTNPQNKIGIGPLALFSITAANPDSFNHVRQQTTNNGSVQVAWEDMTGGGDQDFNDVVLNIGSAALKIPGTPGQTAPTTVTLTGLQKNLNYEQGVFKVDDVTGKIGNLEPSDKGYAAAAFSQGNYQAIFANNQAVGAETTLNLNSDSLLGLYLIPNSTTAQFISQNSSNIVGSTPNAFFSFAAANPDGADHLWRSSDDEFAFDDTINGGDRTFNALTFRFLFAQK